MATGAQEDDFSETTWRGMSHEVWVRNLICTLRSPAEVKEVLHTLGKKRVADEVAARGILQEMLKHQKTARQISDMMEERATKAQADRKRKLEIGAETARKRREEAKREAAAWDGKTWAKDAVPLGYSIERAKSARSHCVKCSEAIPNKSLRIKLSLKCHTWEVRYCECDRCEKGRSEMARLGIGGFYHLACCTSSTPGLCVTVSELKLEGTRGGWSKLTKAEKELATNTLAP